MWQETASCGEVLIKDKGEQVGMAIMEGGLERAQPEGRGPIRFMAGVQEGMAQGYGMGNGAEQAHVRYTLFRKEYDDQ